MPVEDSTNKERDFGRSCGHIHTRINALAQHSYLPSAEGFYPQNLACTPKNDEVPYMLLYIEGTKIRIKTKCIPNFKMQWNPVEDTK